MSGIPLQPGIIYGPILSRRLGRSLGINLMPTDRKICSFNCIYCQYGPARAVHSENIEDIFPTVDEVLLQVEKALKKPRTIDYLTFSGNGEPTLHPDFPDIVRGIKSLRDKHRPDTKLAILSNSSGVITPGIVTSLKLLDSPMMKLDAGDEETFNAINRPAHSIKFGDIVEGLKLIPNLMIQCLLVDGKISNVRNASYDAWLKLLVDLLPREIHIYSIERPTADEGIDRVPPKKLEKIAADLCEKYQLPVKAFW